MKIKKIFYRLLLPIFTIASLVSVTTVVLLKNHTISSTQIEQDVEKPTEEVNEDFVSQNLDINLSIGQKMQILRFESNKVYINLDEFKYHFLQEFYKLGPLNDKATFRFYVDDIYFIKAISIKYILNFNQDYQYIWNYSIKNI
ncbi:hypothetical protein SCHIN_v1c10480 [Spiroplasma chinense]|uniref:Uncharacterized protein n=1 Tax=Spiroplasma chinense TaxID=216932 RepID=A0A5B9Y5C2_9MOLU|nr:hypothetical protein [Spiroplasma chinense]QEH62241.1 hypothetical protein SCHIN_v1c10480 [Spiroplasma chinense]